MAESHRDESKAVSRMLHELANAGSDHMSVAGTRVNALRDDQSVHSAQSRSHVGRPMPYLAAFADAGQGGGLCRGDVLDRLREAREASEAHQARLLDAVAMALDASLSPP